jgi:hypothetical protein
MASLEKKFHFVSDTEGWVATLGNANQAMAWQKPNHQTHQVNPILSGLGGSLKTVAKNNTPSSENYWKWQGTWESLGVPVGAIVTAVNADYLYRWKQRHKNNKANEASFTNTQTGAGPFEFRKADNTLIGTFSTRKFCIARGVGNYWKAYPSGDPDGSNTFHPGTWSTQYPIVETPSAWALATGTEIAVPSAQQPSNTTIQLRLRNLMPATALWDTSAIPKPPSLWVRLKQDHVVLTITYTVSDDESNDFFQMFL